MESYTHMSELEGQVKSLEDQVKALEGRLSEAYSELNNKDNLVKQHAKVAEDAVSGNIYDIPWYIDKNNS